MRDGWIQKALGDIAEVVMGQSPPGSTYNMAGDGMPFIQGSAEFGPRYPEPVQWCSAPRKVAEAGDLLISVRAPVGDLNFAREPIAIGRGLAVVRGTDDALVEFLGLAIQHALPELRSRAGGGMFESVTKQGLLGLELMIPPLDEQRRIVDLIAAVDAYNFDAATTADHTRTARRALLSQLLSEAGQAAIDTTLGEVAELKIGKTPPRATASYWTKDLKHPFCTIADMSEWNVNPAREGVTDRAIEDGRAKRVPAGSLLMSFKLTIGRVGIAAVDLFPNEAIVWIEPAAEIDRDFLALWLDHLDLEEYASRAVKGKTLNGPSLRAIPVSIPPLAEQRRIVDLIAAVDASITAADSMLAQAITARSALLADLLSGDHEIPESYDAFLDVTA